MAPIMNIPNENDYQKMIKIADAVGIKYTTNLKNQDNSDFIYVPSIKLYVAKEKTLFGKNWFECNEELHSKGERMPTIPEFREFLKYAKENYKNLYNEITQVRSPWRAEWIDADFKVENKNLIVNYHAFNDVGDIIKKTEVLDKNTLMKNKLPGISLEAWLNDKNSTKQGLPKKIIDSGDLYYWYPREDNNSFARFDADSDWAYLNCDWSPSIGDSYLGVRAVRHE